MLTAWLALRRFVYSRSVFVVRIRGALAFERNGNDIECISITGYSFNKQMCNYLRAFLNENKAYREIFFAQAKPDVKDSDCFNPDELNYHCIINSVLEFAILRQLDLHLNAYFVQNEIDKAQITTITRKQLPPSVLKNRVLDLITRDMKEREAFLALIPSAPKHFAPSLIALKLVIRLKHSLFSGRHTMELYAWLDSFIDELNQDISVDVLTRRLDPDLIKLLKSEMGAGSNRRPPAPIT